MDMDPLTRSEALRIEEVLDDLVFDLELLSYLPEEFNLWLRDDCPIVVGRFEAQQLPELIRAGGVDARYPPNATGDAAEEREETLEELQRLCKASGFMHTAAQYGDPADTAGNEALLQLADFSTTERELLETATTVGHVDEEDIDHHRLSLRALLDTLRGGGYHSRMRALLRALYPAQHDSASSGSAAGAAEAGGGSGLIDGDGDDALTPERSNRTGRLGVGGGHDGVTLIDSQLQPRQHQHTGQGISDGGSGHFNREAALATEMLSASVDAFADMIRTLARLVRLRNATTVNEDVQRYKVLHEAVNKEQSATADVQALNREYNAIRAARRDDVAALDEEIARLEAELAYVRRAADVELEAMQEVNEKIRSDRAGTYRHRLEQHREAAAALETKFEQLVAQHVEDAGVLRTALAKKEAAVSGAIAEYDAQTTATEAAMRQLQRLAEEGTARIVTLEESIEKLQTEQREHEWEHKVVEQRQSHLHALRQRQEQDARVVQAYARAFMTRLEVEKEMTAKSKKKKGPAKKK